MKRKYTITAEIPADDAKGVAESIKPGEYFADTDRMDDFASVWVGQRELLVHRPNFIRFARAVNP